MRPLSALSVEDINGIDKVVFDLDDTLLSNGKLEEDAYSALFRLRVAGFTLIASTGRPASFAEVAVRQWPIQAAIAENGGVAFHCLDGPLTKLDTCPGHTRRERRARLETFTETLRNEFELQLADDNHGRITDVAFDIGEHHRVAPEVVERARNLARVSGFRTFCSNIHMHLTLDAFDKATGFAALMSNLQQDPVRELRRAAFLGDSANDGPAFAAFGLTLGVANVRKHLAKLTVAPRFVSHSTMGRGFSEIAARLVELRA